MREPIVRESMLQDTGTLPIPDISGPLTWTTTLRLERVVLSLPRTRNIFRRVACRLLCWALGVGLKWE